MSSKYTDVRAVVLTPCFGGSPISGALQKLGFSPYTFTHSITGKNALFHPRQVMKAFRRQPRGTVDLATLLNGYDSVAGLPGSALWPQLTARFPKAKFILEKYKPTEDEKAALCRAMKATSRAGIFSSHASQLNDYLTVLAHEQEELLKNPDNFIGSLQSFIPKERLLIIEHINNEGEDTSTLVRSKVFKEHASLRNYQKNAEQWHKLCSALNVSCSHIPSLNSTEITLFDTLSRRMNRYLCKTLALNFTLTCILLSCLYETYRDAWTDRTDSAMSVAPDQYTCRPVDNEISTHD